MLALTGWDNIEIYNGGQTIQGYEANSEDYKLMTKIHFYKKHELVEKAPVNDFDIDFIESSVLKRVEEILTGAQATKQ